MTVKVISRRIIARQVTIKLVDGSLIQGKINLYNDEAMVQRVSDVFTKLPDPFVVVFEATAEGKNGRILVLNKKNVVWVSVEDKAPSPWEEEEPLEAAGALLWERLPSP